MGIEQHKYLSKRRQRCGLLKIPRNGNTQNCFVMVKICHCLQKKHKKPMNDKVHKTAYDFNYLYMTNSQLFSYNAVQKKWWPPMLCNKILIMNKFTQCQLKRGKTTRKGLN